MKRTTRIISSLVILLFIIGCSAGSNDPIQPTTSAISYPDIPVDKIDNNLSGRDIAGVWTTEFNLESLTATTVRNRNSAFHFDVTQYINQPYVSVISYSPITGIIDVDVTITNPMDLDGFDLRLIIYTDEYGVALQNPDNWTNLWDIPGGSEINPFKAYAKTQYKREFEALAQHTERLQIYLPDISRTITFAIDVSFPDNCEEPYKIENFKQGRLKSVVGSNTKLQVDVYDWQDDVNAVSLYCPLITGDPFASFAKIDDNTWEMLIINNEGASAGEYAGVIVAGSENSGTYAIYDFVSINVYENIIADWTIFYYPYEENLYSLRNNINEMEVVGSQEGDLNMIVCWDITGTTDDVILEIQKDPDGYNNTIISPVIEDFGEVIPDEGLDMVDPETLTKFLKFAIREYPAEKYGFIVLSHGNYGIYYHVPEDKSIYDDMGIWEFNDAIMDALDIFPEVDQLDFVGLESCTMSFIEMAYGLTECAKAVWASEYVMYVSSCWYEEVLAELLEDIEMDGYEFADIFVNNTLSHGGAFTYGAWRSEEVEAACIPALNILAQSLIDNLPTYRTEITECRGQSDSWGNHCEDYRITDLGFFCANLINYEPALPVDLTDAAQNMIDAKDATFITFGTIHSGEGCYFDATGWQILFTDQFNNPDEEYQYKVRDVIQNIGFADATLWDEFLIEYDDHQY